MQHPGGGPGAGGGSSQDDLTDLLAPADVQFHPPRAPARPRRVPPPVPVTRPGDGDDAAPDLTRTPDAPAPEHAAPSRDAPAPDAGVPADAPVGAPVDQARVDHAPVDRGSLDRALGPPTGPSRPVTAHRTEDVVTFGRWFQPVAGGVLPHPDPAEPVVAVVRASGGSTVHAVTAGRVRRSPVTLAAGGLELAGEDGTTLVLTGPPDTAWVRDDEDVTAGEVVGVLPTDDGADDGVELRVLAIGADGVPRDAVDLLVGLPDPGELDLGPGLGTDPFALDLEIAGRAQSRRAR